MIILTVICTLLAVATMFSWFILWRVWRTNLEVNVMQEHLSQMFPMVAEAINRSVEVMDRKEGKIGLNMPNDG